MALSVDGSIEAIKHETLPWQGWMWHPERYSEFCEDDGQRIRNLFAK
jgi:putative glutamine amidotransferase